MILFDNNDPQSGGKWSPWSYVPVTSTIEDKSKTPPETKIFRSTFGVVASNIVPANKFWIQFPMSNCDFNLPWNSQTYQDPLPLASSGTLIGALAGIAIANMQPPRAVFHDLATGVRAPIAGYCVSDVFSERLYTKIFASTTGSFIGRVVDTLGGEQIIWEPDVIQRYCVKRIYVHHGLITGVFKDSKKFDLLENEYAIGLGINTELDDSFLGKTAQINVVTQGGKQLSLKISRFLKNWLAVIEKQEGVDAPSSGDYYVLDTVLVAEDPLLMGGLWLESEKNATIGISTALSGFDLFATSNQNPYTQLNIIGGYALKNKKTNDFSAGSVGQSMNDSGDFTWAWCLFSQQPSAGRIKISDSYGNDKERIKWEYVPDAKEAEKENQISVGQYISKHEVRDKCSEGDVLYGVKNGGNHVRLEIAECGSSARNNFHAPILKNEYLFQGGKAFKILDQVDGATIDVSYTATDGKTKLNIKGVCTMLNQYVWKINEHYRGIQDTLFGFGKIDSKKDTSIKIKIKEDDMGSGTLRADAFPFLKPGEGYLKRNTFAERFFKDIPESKMGSKKKMYVKGQEWILICKNKDTDARIPIAAKKVTYAGEKKEKVDGKEYIFHYMEVTTSQDISVILDSLSDDVEGFYFDRPYSINGFSGGTFMDKPRPRNGKLCLNGNLFSPIVGGNLPSSTTVGICESVWWYNGNNLTRIFIKVPKGTPSTSCFFNDNPYVDGVLYNDFLSEKLTLRIGTLDFRANPDKIEIAVGEKKKQTANGPEIELNTKDADRLNALYLYDLPEVASSEDQKAVDYLTFSSGSKNNIIGFFVTGQGDVNLHPLFSEEDRKLFSTDFKNNGETVSPLYMYTKGQNNPKGSQKIHIGIKTSEGPVIVNKGISDEASVGKITAIYTNENQTIDETPYAIHKLKDGEKIILYNKSLGYDINIEGKKIETSKWKYSSYVIMVTGSPDFYDGWGTPFVKKPTEDGGAWTIPVMIANGCEYMDSILWNDNLYVFAKCFDDNGVPFVGMFKIQINTISNNLTFGSHAYFKGGGGGGGSGLPTFGSAQYREFDVPFWYRSFSDPKAPFTTESNKIAASGSVNKQKTEDIFRKVLGPTSVKPYVDLEADWGVVSTCKLNSGHMLMFYNNQKGLTFAFSNSLGLTWKDSGIILAREGSCGFMFDGDFLFYLIPGTGLHFKRTSDVLFDKIINYVVVEGTKGKNLEILQKELDNLPIYSTGTGALNSQKFSGYVTNTGIYKVFYYDNQGKLACVQSSDSFYWFMADNF